MVRGLPVNSITSSFKFFILLTGFSVGVYCFMVHPSTVMAGTLPVSLLSDEDTDTSEMNEKIDSFLDNLEKYAEDPDKALDELKAWTEEQNQKEKENAKGKLKSKNEQVKVFFGGWASFFAVVITLFLLKFGFNIFRDSLIFIIAKVKNFMPWFRTAGTYFMGNYLPPSETRSEDEIEDEETIAQKNSFSGNSTPE
jgi:hypothetical protein